MERNLFSAESLTVAEVILDLAIDKPLDYSIPESFLNAIVPGVRVEVPIRGKPTTGTVVKLKSASEFPELQSILNYISDEVLITQDLLELSLWIARYYCCSLGKVFKTVLPSSVRRNMQSKEQLAVTRNKTYEQLRDHCIHIRNQHPKQAAVLDVILVEQNGILLSELMEKGQISRSPIDTLVKQGFLKLEKVHIDRSPLKEAEYFKSKPKILNEAQQAAFDSIKKNMFENHFSTHLIHGITGSGKTEIYLQAIDEALKQNKGAIMLVPEISLTTQMIERFRTRFEGQIAILHHRLSQGERLDEWHRLRKGEAKIAIGARSAIFSPIKNLGLIIVDEEHEFTYKQTDDTPCYHARDVAVMRGKITNGIVILGSATPSLESYQNALTGKYRLETLPTRADSASLPHIKIVDMRLEDEKAKRHAIFSDALLKGIEQRTKQGEQSILFLNRRGYYTSLICPECSLAVKCQHCDTTLTFHRNQQHLSCHLCGYTTPPPPTCPSCNQTNPMKFRGYGTEQIERSLHAILPDIRTIRLDADTTRHKGSHQRLIRDFGCGKADVLIGTQMIAKGLHFPEVTLVGVLNCDSSLNIPDFRASETGFQLMTQVAGRSGRGFAKGEVIFQTRMPENSTIQYAIKQDFKQFFDDELNVRKFFDYPPFTKLAKVTFAGSTEGTTYGSGEAFRSELAKLLPSSFEIHPLIPCGHAKIKDQFRYHFLIKGKDIYTLSKVLHQIHKPGNVKVYIDIDPASTFF